ncbi:MAG: hypothetical protein ACI9TI_000883 [Natronomonas sp.]|jgi:hypothetical protein|uniref:hypothetical protein n=1 Tax=Natronomonas sp. TaxID=2184060 RepID=UPI003989B56D
MTFDERDDEVARLLAEYDARGLIPDEVADDVDVAVEAGDAARALRLITKRRRHLRRDDSAENPE